MFHEGWSGRGDEAAGLQVGAGEWWFCDFERKSWEAAEQELDPPDKGVSATGLPAIRINMTMQMPAERGDRCFGARTSIAGKYLR